MPNRPIPPAGRPAPQRPSAQRPLSPRSPAKRPTAQSPTTQRPAAQAPTRQHSTSPVAGTPGMENSGRDLASSGKFEVAPKVVVSSLNERLAERARRDRVRNWRKIGWWTAIIAVVALLGWLAFFSSVFALEKSQITVSSQGQYIDPNEVDGVLAQYIGVPLPRIDTVNLRSELAELGAVRSVTVTRVWPDGLEVTLVAREPVAAVPDGAGGFALVDAEGTAIAVVSEVPEATAAIEIPLRDGEVDERILRAVLAVLTNLPEELLVQVERIAASTLDDITLTLADGAVVFWGSAESSELKGEVLRVLRTSPDVSDVAVYDVSAPEMPITKATP